MNVTKQNIGIGIIGAGYISCAHAIAFNSAAAIMEPNVSISFAAACSPFADELAGFKKRFNFAKGYENWEELVADPAVDLVVIGTPPNLHYAQTKLALEQGKHVLCEKPVAMNAAECQELYELAARNGLSTAVGLTYLANPGMFLARELVQEGKLGQIYSFNGHFNEDHLASPELPWHWHCDEQLAGYGATNDLGYHISGKLISLFGLPRRVVGCRQVKVAERRDAASGELRRVTSDDMASAVLEYENGITGTWQVSRVATGRDQFIHLEVNGSNGSFVLDMENMNHFRLFLRDEDKRLEGFRQVMIGPEHKNYSRFCPAAGHGLGFNDFIVIQNGHLLGEIAGTAEDGGGSADSGAGDAGGGGSRGAGDAGGGTYRAIADLGLAWQVQQLVDAIAQSSDTEQWVELS